MVLAVAHETAIATGKKETQDRLHSIASRSASSPTHDTHVVVVAASTDV